MDLNIYISYLRHNIEKEYLFSTNILSLVDNLTKCMTIQF